MNMETTNSLRIRASRFCTDRYAYRTQPSFLSELVAFGVIVFVAIWPMILLANAMAAAPREPKEKEVTVTGSVTRPAVASAASAPAAPPKPQVGRLPTLDGWVLRDVRRGGALIEGRAGLYEVYAGDPVPGLGRVDAIRKQDGHWVVVTEKGLIVARQ